ncbi:MAG: hypothetical protein HY332_04875 [Chloroflexi bacterium]|nr:hypothetical protein [Chloroflexota bacterium]
MDVTARIDRLEDALASLAATAAQTEQRLQQVSAETGARLDELAAAGAQTEQRLREFSTATQARLDELAAAGAHADARLAELAAAGTQTRSLLDELAASVTRTDQQLAALATWQRGEEGRRRGERYERRLLRGAIRLFRGGAGGTAEHEGVRARLASLVAPALDAGYPDDADPALADLLWWKGEQLAVVEASMMVVDDQDVYRAQRRAETLRRAGIRAIPVVVGEAWADDETRRLARERGVEWKVGDDLSPGLIDFQRVPIHLP